jgi:hypothetical protein
LRVRGGLVHGATQESPVSAEKVHLVLLVAKLESNGSSTDLGRRHQVNDILCAQCFKMSLRLIMSVEVNSFTLTRTE